MQFTELISTLKSHFAFIKCISFAIPIRTHERNVSLLVLVVMGIKMFLFGF